LEYLHAEEKPDAQKILFTGLDDAGKTSIILALQREFSKIAVIKPSRGAQRRIFEFLGKEISEWDLGGQSSYRISYLKNPDKYFDRTEIAIYVIDIQNKTRIQESLSYLNDVIKQFKILEIDPPIFIFFHKFDPVLTKSAHDQVNNLYLYLKDRISKIPNSNFFYYTTTIFDLSTIMKAMSEILLAVYPKTDLIQKAASEFANKFDAEGLEIIDSNSLIVGSYYMNDDIKTMLTSSTPYFLSLNNSFHNSTKSEEEKEPENMVIQRYGKYFLFRQFMLREKSPPYYLLLMKANESFNIDDFNAFVNLLKEILYK
jgi:GTPase SAR1 family protein